MLRCFSRTTPIKRHISDFAFSQLYTVVHHQSPLYQSLIQDHFIKLTEPLSGPANWRDLEEPVGPQQSLLRVGFNPNTDQSRLFYTRANGLDTVELLEKNVILLDQTRTINIGLSQSIELIETLTLKQMLFLMKRMALDYD